VLARLVPEALLTVVADPRPGVAAALAEPLGARGVEDPAAKQAYWTPAIRYLHRNLAAGFRVEAVDTSGHWPAYFLARADIPLVRGWFRQEDFPQNHILYAQPRPRTYVRWLRRLSVRYVVLTSATPDYSARAEAKLLRSGRSGLAAVLRTNDVTIFRVPSPQPLVSAPARVLALGYASIRLAVPRAGAYRLAVNYSPYWQTRRACVLPAATGMTKLLVYRPGEVTLRFAFSATRALKTLEGDTDRCASGAARTRLIPIVG
jgi:hypothetical protein